VTKSVHALCRYARDVIKGPWPEAEYIILRDSKWAPWYRAFTAPRTANGPELRRQLEKFYTLDYELEQLSDSGNDAWADFANDWGEKEGSAIGVWGWQNHAEVIIKVRAAVDSGMEVESYSDEKEPFEREDDGVLRQKARLLSKGYEILAYEDNLDSYELIVAKWA